MRQAHTAKLLGIEFTDDETDLHMSPDELNELMATAGESDEVFLLPCRSVIVT